MRLVCGRLGAGAAHVMGRQLFETHRARTAGHAALKVDLPHFRCRLEVENLTYWIP
jgi:hypothetical protein